VRERGGEGLRLLQEGSPATKFSCKKVRLMRPNPLTDALSFLADASWPRPVFWLLLLGSAAAAVIVWRRDPAQRSVRHAGICLLRIVIGTMWWQQSLWKVPPHYDWGLIHWMQEMVEHASTELQSVLVRDLVLPNIAIFGPLVYAIEVAIAVSLILGVATRLGALLGALMAINLWLGLYNAPTEWPWTYMFLVVLQLIYLIDPPGRSLGVDALFWRREETVGGSAPGLSWVA
jgi:uncharacterized membrane protein YphA (DoxX/SURF4 family)